MLLASCCAATYSCAFLPSLRFIGEQQLAHQLQYKDSTVGGLSGIDYDVDTDTCILLSDERSRHNAARFYTATLDYDETSFNRVILNDVVYFIQQNQASSPEQANEIVDLEDIRFDPLDGSIWYVSEGDRRLGLNPFIRQATRQGEFISELALHQMFSMHADRELGCVIICPLRGSAFLRITNRCGLPWKGRCSKTVKYQRQLLKQCCRIR